MALCFVGGRGCHQPVFGGGQRPGRAGSLTLRRQRLQRLVTALGALCVSSPALTVSLGDLLDFGQTSLRLDQLAGLFLTLSGSLGVVISLALANWPARPVRAGGRAAPAGYLLLLASVTVTIAAADAFTFLFAWETLTVAFYVLSDRHSPPS